MNSFKTTDNGGLPLTLDDFRWIDSGYREAFKGMMSAYGIVDSTAVILKGCVRTVALGTVSISAGYISIGGEICLVPAHTYPEPTVGQVEYWDLYVSYDPTGDKVFQSTLNYDTYEARVAKITVASSVPAGYTLQADAKDIFWIIAENLPDINNRKQYIANLSQVGGADPGLPTFVQENEMPTTRPWIRASTGVYRLDHTADGIVLFPDATKITWHTSGIKDGGSAYLFKDNNYRLTLKTYDASGTLSDDLLDNTTIFFTVNP